MTEKNKSFSGTRIGILGKGGSGKSTVTALLAKTLANQNYQVCVFDADSTNLGLHQALGFDKPPTPLIHYFGGAIFSGGSVTCPVDDPTPLPGAEISLDKLPNNYYLQNQEGIFLFALGKIGDRGPGAGCDGPISKITRDLKISGIGDYPVTLIDLKAGLEDPARGVITGLDWVITVVDPTNAAIQIAIDIKNIINQIKSGKLPATRHLKNPALVKTAQKIFKEAKIKDSFVLLNKIKDKEIESYLRKKLEEKGIEPLGIMWEDPSISLSWLKETSLMEIGARKDIERFIKRLKKNILE